LFPLNPEARGFRDPAFRAERAPARSPWSIPFHASIHQLA
jgi:hypothetical protein